MDYTASKQSSQRATLARLLNQQKFTDTTFIIGSEKEEYNVNRVFLASVSPVFEAMLFGGMKESKPNSDVIIEDMKPKIFESILNFAYCNDPNITINNVIEIIQASDKYQINMLLTWCEEYFRSHLNSSNFCTLFNHAITLKEERSISICNSFIETDSFNAIQIMQSDGWNSMNLHAMRIILASDYLTCKEEEIWKYVVAWSEYQRNMHKKDKSILNFDDEEDEKCDNNDDVTGCKANLLTAVCDLIRFGLMNGRYFATKVVPENILSKEELISIFVYFHYPEGGCGAFNTSSRTSTSLLKYTLSMSSKHTLAANTYAALINDNLTDNCGTEKDPNDISYIKADFGAKVHLTKIEVAASFIPRFKHGGTKFLSGYKFGMRDENEANGWKLLQRLPQFKQNKVETINVDVKTTGILFNSIEKNEHLGIGVLRVYGRKIK